MPAASGEHTVYPLSCSGTVEAFLGPPVGAVFAIVQTSQPITLRQIVAKSGMPLYQVRGVRVRLYCRVYSMRRFDPPCRRSHTTSSSHSPRTTATR